MTRLRPRLHLGLLLAGLVLMTFGGLARAQSLGVDHVKPLLAAQTQGADRKSVV